MATPTVYVICDQNCKFEGMTKEQILTAIMQAVNEGTIGNIDVGFVTTIKTINGTPLKFFVGSQYEYNALTEEQREGLFAIITDDTTKDALFNALELLQDDVTSLKNNVSGMQRGKIVVGKAEVAKNIIPTNFTADEIKPTMAGLYAITLANPRATVLLSIEDLTKNTSASVEVEYGTYPTVPKLKTYIVKYTSGKIWLDAYAYIRSDTTTFEKIQQDNIIESCYLILPYGSRETIYYSITTNLENCRNAVTATEIIDGDNYTDWIMVNDGYNKLVVTVTMGGVDITDDCVYSNDGVVHISIDNVTGDIVITATAIEDETPEETTIYTVTNNLANCTNSNTNTTVAAGEAYSGTITPIDGYHGLTATVTMGGVDITNSCISGNSESNVITINNVTGDIVITVTAVEDETTGNDPDEGEPTAEYQLVEYIETDGNQYIDTGISPAQFNGSTMNVYFEGERNGHNTNGAAEYLFGCRDYNGDDVNSIGNVCVLSNPKNVLLEVGQADNAVTYIGEIAKYERFSIRTQSKVDDLALSMLLVGNVGGAKISSYELSGVQTWNSRTIYLLWCNGASEESIPYCGKVYGVTISCGSEEILNLVPCYRTSDNVIGMYDTITGKFFTNIGTGAFEKGANIN